MPKKNKTPGVFIEEINSLPNSVAQVETAIPAFIGYTPQAILDGESCLFKPQRVTSMDEFLNIYGYPADSETKKRPAQYSPSYYLTQQKSKPTQGTSHTLNGQIYTIEPDPNTIYYLYNSLQLFFQNGGSQAYIVSTGTYGPISGKPITPGDQMINPNVLRKDLEKGLTTLKKFQEVTMYIFPEATLLDLGDNGTLMETTLLQCGEMRTAVAIFDVIGGREPDPILWTDDIQNFRNATGNNFLDYGVAYYPYCHTTAVLVNEVSYVNINGGDIRSLIPILSPASAPDPQIEKAINQIAAGNQQSVEKNSAMLLNLNATYKQLLTIVQGKINTLPPSGIMAGVYSMVDANEGVWKAPANVSPIGVTDITLRIDGPEQENLNVDAVSGKSINALRFFNGHGVLVWGARTLDGNSQNWRYISVRRTLIMIEQSAKRALSSFVFEPNTAATWLTVKSMLENFLTNLWSEGALMGSKTSDAFSVKVGLGDTMTAQDIQDDRLRVSLFLAVTRPAEFIEVTVEQDMATS